MKFKREYNLNLLVMKKNKKFQLKLDKKIIAFLSDAKLDLLKGGVTTIPSKGNCGKPETFDVCGARILFIPTVCV